MGASRHEDRVEKIGIPVQRRVTRDKTDLDDVLAADQAVRRDDDMVVDDLNLKGPAVHADVAERGLISVDEINRLRTADGFERETNRLARRNRFALRRGDAESELIPDVANVRCALCRQT